MNYGKETKIVFFGSSDFSIYVLDELLLHNIKPKLIVTTPDKPKGRKLILTPTPTKVWAKEHNIEVLAPIFVKNNSDLRLRLASSNSDLFLVASYGKIIPREIFDIPEKKTLNIHPSLLPKYRGASPIQAQILNDEKEIGVTIMQIEEVMDSGPIIAQKQITPLTPLTLRGEQKREPPSPASRGRGQGDEVLGKKELEKILAIEGARLFAHILPEWLAGAIQPIMQNEAEATYCKKITKEDGLLDLADNPRKNLLKIKAYQDWPGTYFLEEGQRIIIHDAKIESAQLKLLRVTPEGKKEMSYDDFLRGKRKS